MASSMKPVSRFIDGKKKKTWKWRTDWIFIYFRKFNNGNFYLLGCLFSVVDLIFFSFGFFFPIFWSSLGAGHIINCRSDMWYLNFSFTKSAVACRSLKIKVIKKLCNVFFEYSLFWKYFHWCSVKNRHDKKAFKIKSFI